MFFIFLFFKLKLLICLVVLKFYDVFKSINEAASSNTLDAGLSSSDLVEIDSFAVDFQCLVFEAHGACPSIVWIWVPLANEIVDLVV